jgi:hypothetical protein
VYVYVYACIRGFGYACLLVQFVVHVFLFNVLLVEISQFT